MADTTINRTRPQRRFSFTWRPTHFFWVLGAVLLLIGASSIIQRLGQGLAPTALGSYVPWGLWVGFYDYLVWLEVGSLLIFTTLVYVVGFKKLGRIKMGTRPRVTPSSTSIPSRIPALAPTPSP